MRLAEELGEAGRYLDCDVTREADIAAAVALADTTWGRLDLMFNNAGRPGDPNPVETMPVEDGDATFAILVRSVMLGIKHATPVMSGRGAAPSSGPPASPGWCRARPRPPIRWRRTPSSS